MTPETKRKLAVGVLQWAGVGIGLVSAYMLTLDSMAEWDWFAVIKGALAHLAAGVAALAAFVSKLVLGQGNESEAPVAVDTSPATVPPAAIEKPRTGYYPGRKFSDASRANLETCHPDLQRVARRALELSLHDFACISGARTKAQQQILVNTGKSQTMNSGHTRIPSIAVDVMAYGPTGATWQAEPYYTDIRYAFDQAAQELGVPMRALIQLTAGPDLGHHELDRRHYPDVALA